MVQRTTKGWYDGNLQFDKARYNELFLPPPLLRILHSIHCLSQNRPDCTVRDDKRTSNTCFCHTTRSYWLCKSPRSESCIWVNFAHNCTYYKYSSYFTQLRALRTRIKYSQQKLPRHRREMWRRAVRSMGTAIFRITCLNIFIATSFSFATSRPKDPV